MDSSAALAQSPFDPAHHRIERVLCFAAHPDDLDFGAAGTIAAWTAAGVQVSYCIMTDGDAGGFDPGKRDEIVRLRIEEQRRAAALVGVTDIHYLHELDGYLEASHSVIRDVVRLIRTLRPDVVLSMHPERNWTRIQKSHPDHLAVGEAVTRAVYPALENPFAYPELAEAGLEAYKLPWLWLFAGPDERDNHVMDVTDHVEAKLAAIHVHVSQHPDLEAMDRTVRGLMLRTAERANLPSDRSAEAFHVVSVNGPGTIAGF
ncbi:MULTISPECIES: PIG-L deacetylase family protein [unclassified Arthrobacter]|uniref:PIG-L deacetylase family protein n=1 Tax=unclassified Arthrobacter TaxID=235627 RepID=UPI002E08B96C|nr:MULTISPECIES: PIG-L deacetylase family protein [unclassified Arthrobacter]MEC5191603.1 LmbE family N-acetylglucosaminyl deacetylase [Arthrobacter sp. MP_M4]MEC5203103.1 LmbE family N-acetylglucosaminyl deacetylase [Arthrobacter sp. MP_M7]